MNSSQVDLFKQEMDKVQNLVFSKTGVRLGLYGVSCRYVYYQVPQGMFWVFLWTLSKTTSHQIKDFSYLVFSLKRDRKGQWFISKCTKRKVKWRAKDVAYKLLCEKKGEPFISRHHKKRLKNENKKELTQRMKEISYRKWNKEIGIDLVCPMCDTSFRHFGPINDSATCHYCNGIFRIEGVLGNGARAFFDSESEES